MLYVKQPLTSTPLPPPAALCGQEERGCDVAWVGDQTYSKVSLLS